MGHVIVDVTCCNWLRHHLGDVMKHTSESQQLPGVDGSMSVLGKGDPRTQPQYDTGVCGILHGSTFISNAGQGTPCTAKQPDCLTESAAALTRLPPTAPRSLRRQQRQCLLWTWPLTLFS